MEIRDTEMVAYSETNWRVVRGSLQGSTLSYGSVNIEYNYRTCQYSGPIGNFGAFLKRGVAPHQNSV